MGLINNLFSISLTFFIFGALVCVSAQESRIHQGDIVDVDFVGGFEFDWRGGLTPEGNLDGLDAVGGPIYALCLTEAELGLAIKKVYSKILRNPEVAVRIVDRSGRAIVRMDGAIKTPARFRLLRPVTLRELIVVAGGFTDSASGDISIFRPKNASCSADAAAAETALQSNPLQTITVKISELLRGWPSANPWILSGDIINVEKAPVIYVIGAVTNPRPIFSRAELTLTRAIATAGGLAKEADSKRISVIRREGTQVRNIEVDLAKIRRGESADVILKAFDIIDVASRGGEKRKFQPVELAAVGGPGPSEPPLRVID